jgi:hypothetical protein
MSRSVAGARDAGTLPVGLVEDRLRGEGPLLGEDGETLAGGQRGERADAELPDARPAKARHPQLEALGRVPMVK